MFNQFQRLMEAAENQSGSGDGGGDDAANAATRQDLERRASEMGWSPRDKWRGAPERWVDADVFVRRGEEIMPILQANSRKEQARVQKLEAELQAANAKLTAAQESIQVLTNVYDQTSLDAAKQKRKELIRQKAAAREADDSDLEVDLEEQIADQTAVIREAEKDGVGKTGAKAKPAAAAASSPSNPAADPTFVAWNQDNPWFGTDTRKTAVATEIGRELRANPANNHLQGRAFFDKVGEETDKYYAQFNGGSQRSGSKVEGGGGNGGGGGGNSNASSSTASGHSYSELPADAKAACQRQASWVVGEGRAFKDMAAWQKHYTQMYFNS